ncbi:acyl-CoA dehydrogenase [Actinokineospora globicatena]|uniref:acyl-CoA dehydrogenase family protein n=1 Tax=Actinokineospora globicatena TaxID=103729 RepID=UPI0020A49F0B|nr:acyl-CoA dehydrogenase [Actinokineospora globicatena]MCP2304318.1 Acyl-coenzyme A oxidase [Actinokineospora globicatena]GLW78320.1 acyl-CoA oxidase [Actinokineospora globicatena]GLW85016.1 acyl-CoA oxidase [Actinokineospora globicatena]
MPIPATNPVAAGLLTELLDGRWAHVRREARLRMAALPSPATYDLTTEQHREQVFAELHELAKSGYPRVGFPVSHGGEGDVGGSLTSFEMLGFGDLSLMVKAGVQWGLFGGAVEALGTERHLDRYLPEIMDLGLPGCFAMTETGHGSDVQHLRTTATYDPDTGEFVLDTPDIAARKDYIGNAARDGRIAVVFAQLITGGEGRGVHALLVPLRDDGGRPLPGITIEDCGRKAGLNGVDNGRIWFDQVRVPRDALLNRYGDVAEDGTYSSPIEGDSRRFFTMLGTLIRGRISVAGAAGSATKNALTIAVRYALDRRQFRNPDGNDEVVLLDYLAHQRKLLPALATSYALHFAQEELVSTLHDGDLGDHGQRELESRAAGIKAATTWHATRAIQACREACGGAGYLAENRLPQLKADTDVFTTFEGDNTVLYQLVAKGLLTGYQQDLHELGSVGMARFIADQFVGTVIERTAARSLIERLVGAVTARDEDADLLDRGWHLRLFEDREKHVLDTLARRLRRAGEPGESAFEVFNAAQDHVLRAARVHVERIVLEAFVAAIDRCADQDAAALLGRVCDLHVLSSVESDLDWFLGHGRLTTSRAKAVTGAVNDLCRHLRPHAAVLVEAFAIPDELVAAPIGLGAERDRQGARRDDTRSGLPRKEDSDRATAS